MSLDLSQEVGLITGASSGIGRATARKLSSLGMSLVLHGRRLDRLEGLQAELAGESKIFAGDIAAEGACDQLFEAAESLGTLSFVFNNAGTMEVAPVESIDIDKACDMVRVNVEAAYRLALMSVKLFQKQGSGLLLNTSSILGTKVRPTAGAYAGTKFAIEALSEGLRMELAGSGVKVCCVEPGLVETELQRDWDEPAAKKLGINAPLQPEDLADMVVFLLSQPAHVFIPRLMVLPADHSI